MLIDVVGSRIRLDHPNAGRSVIQDHSPHNGFKRLHLTRASVRRASGFVLTGKQEVIDTVSTQEGRR